MVPVWASHITAMIFAVVYSLHLCGNDTADYSFYCLMDHNVTLITPLEFQYKFWLEDSTKFTIIYSVIIVLTVLSILLSSWHGITEVREKLERSHLVFVYDWHATATGMLDSWLLNNLKTDKYDEIQTYKNWKLTDPNTIPGTHSVKKEIQLGHKI